MKHMERIQRLVIFTILLLCGVLMVYPMIWMLVSSVKSTSDVFSDSLRLIPTAFHWENFANALAAAPFLTYLWNSTWTTTIIVVLQLLFASMVAYALTQFEFFGRRGLFAIILGTYMLPSATTYIPSYVILGKLNLLNSLWGLVISNLANVFSIFLLRQAFLKVPKEVIEAARSDGASEWSILWRIVVPMNRNTLLNAALISFVSSFNDYLWPSLILNDKHNMVISVGLNQFSNSLGSFEKSFPIVMAGTALAVIPLIVVYVILQRYFVHSVQTASVKG